VVLGGATSDIVLFNYMDRKRQEKGEAEPGASGGTQMVICAAAGADDEGGTLFKCPREGR
jgi:hypothetical protein